MKTLLQNSQLYWTKVVQIGVMPHLTAKKKRNIRITNHINLSLIAIAMFCFFIYLSLGDLVISAATIIVSILCTIPILINRAKHYLAAKLTFLFIHFVIYLGLGIVVGHEGNIHMGCLFIFIASLFLFEKAAWRFLFIVLGLGGFIFCELWFEYSSPFIMPSYPMLNNIVSAVIVTFFFYQLISFYKSQTQQTTKKLVDSQKHLKIMVESALDAVIFIDNEAKVLQWNKQAEQLFGYTKQEAIHAYMPELIIPNHHVEGHEKGMKRWEKTKQGTILDQRIEIEAKNKAGRIFPIELTITALEVKNNTIFSAFLRDISEQKKYQNNLMRANEELQQFAGVAAHDLKAPLRSISSFVGLLKPNIPEDSDSQEYFDFISKATKRMNILLDDLMNYANAGAKTIDKEIIDLNKTLRIVKENLYASIQDTNATITVHHLPTIEGHSTLIAQLFQNLISNALKFQKPTVQPVIEVNAQPYLNDWLISVKDNGIGMNQEFAEKIFVPFTRLHSARDYEGSGIGLATCKKIVENYGGKIWAEGEEGKGATFWFTLPALKEEMV